MMQNVPDDDSANSAVVGGEQRANRVERELPTLLIRFNAIVVLMIPVTQLIRGDTRIHGQTIKFEAFSKKMNGRLRRVDTTQKFTNDNRRTRPRAFDKIGRGRARYFLPTRTLMLFLLFGRWFVGRFPCGVVSSDG